MKSFTAVDLERLARGQRVAGDVFRAIFADPEAVADLAGLLQVRQLLSCPEQEPRTSSAEPDMDVSFEELARHGEGRPLDPARRAAVERFLGKHFPEAPAAAESETYVDFLSQDTDIFHPKKD
jgi:hypothetical protein